MTPEEKVLEKFRYVLIGSAIINEYINKRAYTAHVSSIIEPEYPAISLHLLPSGARFAARDFVGMSVQFDIWLPIHGYTSKDCYKIVNEIRILLDRQHLNDATIGVIFAQCIEEHVASIMFEEDTQLLHLPVIYSVIAR